MPWINPTLQRWEPSTFKAAHPILGTRDILGAMDFYTRQLGFTLAFRDSPNDPPNYVGYRRNAVELHMQFQFEHEMGTIPLRLLVEDPDPLFNEFRQLRVECTPTGVRDTPGGPASSRSTTWTTMPLPSTRISRARKRRANLRGVTAVHSGTATIPASIKNKRFKVRYRRKFLVPERRGTFWSLVAAACSGEEAANCQV